MEITTTTTDNHNAPGTPATGPLQNHYPETIKNGWALVGMSLAFQIISGAPTAVLASLAGQNNWNFYGLPETLGYTIAFGLTIRFAFRKRGSNRLAFAPIVPTAFPWWPLARWLLLCCSKP